MKPTVGTFNDFPALADLPVLVRRQRRLEAQLVPLKALEEQEKAVRADIDRALLAAGFTANNTGVTCAGYDVRHNHRDGRASISLASLVAAKVDPAVIKLATTTGEPSNYATVTPCKGAKVRAA